MTFEYPGMYSNNITELFSVLIISYENDAQTKLARECVLDAHSVCIYPNLAHFYTEYQIELNSSAWFMLQTKQQQRQIAFNIKKTLVIVMS